MEPQVFIQPTITRSVGKTIKLAITLSKISILRGMLSLYEPAISDFTQFALERGPAGEK